MTTGARVADGAVADRGELGLHVAARTVLERCPTPVNALEVAVVLETCGYTPGRARTLGAPSVLELAQRVFGLLPLYATGPAVDRDLDAVARRRAAGLVAFLRGLAYSSPWLVSLATTLVAGVSFWSSSIALAPVADAVTLGSSVALLVTAPFVQAFGRRASFYFGLGDQGMVVRMTRFTLELAALATVAACVVLFGLRGPVLGLATPASARVGVAAGLAVAALQLGLAAFYLRRAFVSMAVVVGAAAVLLVWHVTQLGPYVDPEALVTWQLRLLALMAATCWLLSAWWLLRVPDHGRGPLWRPATHAVVRSVAPYALYGLAFFAIVVLPQLVSGGLLAGRYRFNPVFALTSGAGLLVLVPMLAQAVATTEQLLPVRFPAALRHGSVSAVDAFRREVRGYWAAQVAWTVALGLGGLVAVVLGAPRLAGPFPILDDLARHQGLLAIAAAGYLLLGVGVFSSQLLFSLSAPGAPLAGAWLGLAVLVASSAVTWTAGPTSAASVGLLAGAAAFALVAAAGADRAFRHADLTFYRTL